MTLLFRSLKAILFFSLILTGSLITVKAESLEIPHNSTLHYATQDIEGLFSDNHYTSPSGDLYCVAPKGFLKNAQVNTIQEFFYGLDEKIAWHFLDENAPAENQFVIQKISRYAEANSPLTDIDFSTDKYEQLQQILEKIRTVLLEDGLFLSHETLIDDRREIDGHEVHYFVSAVSFEEDHHQVQGHLVTIADDVIIIFDHMPILVTRDEIPVSPDEVENALLALFSSCKF